MKGMNVKQRNEERWTTQVLEASTTEERGGNDRRPNSDVENRTPRKWKKGRNFRLFEDEQPLGGGSLTCSEKYFHGNNYNGNC
jgi:hypothetical protein